MIGSSVVLEKLPLPAFVSTGTTSKPRRLLFSRELHVLGSKAFQVAVFKLTLTYFERYDVH